MTPCFRYNSSADNPSIAAIITAAGSSSRMGGKKKEYLRLLPISAEEKPLTVLGASVRTFASCNRIDPIIIVIPPGGEDDAMASLPEELSSGELSSGTGRILLVTGGPTRRSSVHKALLKLKALESHKVSHVLIHDGARPWVSLGLIEKIIDAAILWGAVIPALPLTETPKELSPLKRSPGQIQFIRRHIKREALWGAQTPQGFKFPEILLAHEKAAENAGKDIEYTDDAEVWGEFIGQVAVIPGDRENRKITYPEDL